MNNYGQILIFLLVGVAFVFVSLMMAYLVRSVSVGLQKTSTYECGEEAVGQSWVQFNIRYYVFALIFVVFDVETIFLYPWAVVFKSLGLFAFVEMIIFIGMLVLGLAYAWRKGALIWG